jgi:hypothetical protein
MFSKSVAKIVLAGVMAAVAMSPALAKSRHTPKPCSNPQLRCYSDCGKDHTCRVYACSLNETIVLPFTCNEKLGGDCWEPHC